jgi:uncharacterized protein (TIGR00251 family)
MIAVTDHPKGVVLPVRARPGAKRSEFLDEHDGALRLTVTAPPDKGRANEAIVELLARELNLPRSRFEILTGETARIKRILVTGIPADELLSRIYAVIEPTAFEPLDPQG